MTTETALLECLVPSWWEVQVTVVAAAFFVFAYWLFTLGEYAGVDDRGSAGDSVDALEDKDESCTYFVDGPVNR